MANELTLVTSLAFAKSGTELSFPDTAKQTLTVTVAGTKFLLNRQSIGTSWEAISLGDISTGGYCVMVNRDSVNYVLIKHGSAAGDDSLVRLNAGEVAVFRVSGSSTTPKAQANAAAVDLEYFLLAA